MEPHLNICGDRARELRSQPENATSWGALGPVYLLQGQRDKVREIYQVLRKLDPIEADKYFNARMLP